jgi:cell wall-associated NlpC family hydrolase
LGANYRAGGTTPDGFDCSGLMYATFKKFDIILPRSSVDMAKIGRVLSTNEIQKGDLIFFKTNGRKVINHVGMVIEVTEDEIKFIHSSTQKGVIVSSTKEPYYEKSFTQANRIL